jgi:hypothetical protein
MFSIIHTTINEFWWISVHSVKISPKTVMITWSRILWPNETLKIVGYEIRPSNILYSWRREENCTFRWYISDMHSRVNGNQLNVQNVYLKYRVVNTKCLYAVNIVLCNYNTQYETMWVIQTPPDYLWRPPILLSSGYWWLSARLGREVIKITTRLPSNAVVKDVEIQLHSPIYLHSVVFKHRDNQYSIMKRKLISIVKMFNSWFIAIHCLGIILTILCSTVYENSDNYMQMNPFIGGLTLLVQILQMFQFNGIIILVFRLCCQCGTIIEPNPSNMCVACLRTQVDITEGIPKQATLHFCKGCERYDL